MIKVEKVDKYFGKLHVLKKVDFHVEEGEVVCVIGPSGSGKSTLLRCLNQLERITNGKVFIDNQLVDYRENDKDMMKKLFLCVKNLEWYSSVLIYSHIKQR